MEDFGGTHLQNHSTTSVTCFANISGEQLHLFEVAASSIWRSR